MRPEPGHLAQLLRSAAERMPGKPALFRKESGAWKSETWREAWLRALKTAAFLESLGVRKGDRIALWSENRPEWLYIDMAALCLGAVTVPIYATLAHNEIRYILQNSGAKILAVSSAANLTRLEPIAGDMKAVERIVVFEGEPHPGSPFSSKASRLSAAPEPGPGFEKRVVEAI